MINIGILTFQCAYNYGALLQCYSLQESIKTLGYKVKVINYCPKNLMDSYQIKIIYKSKHAKLANILHPFKVKQNRRIILNRYSKLNEWRKKYIHLTKVYYTNNELLDMVKLEDLNAIICGSDQIWNKAITDNDPVYYLRFIKNNVRKIAYAASFGIDNISEEYITDYKNDLLEFDYISVREISANRILNNMGINNKIVLDPVLLRSANDWKKIISSERIILHNYLFVYCIGDNAQLIKTATIIAQEKKIKIICVCIGTLIQPKIENVIYKSDVNPSEFLNLLYFSDYVCTNSFHGLCFSILFNKEFLIVQNQLLNSRIYTLLNYFHIENRLINNNDDIVFKIYEKINYINVNLLIEDKRNESLMFLIETLKK